MEEKKKKSAAVGASAAVASPVKTDDKPHKHDDKEYLTKEKHEELKAELERLMSQGRKEIAQNLQYAKSLGDLSENAEYHEAREQQVQIEERISKLQSILKSAVIVSDRHSDVIG